MYLTCSNYWKPFYVFANVTETHRAHRCNHPVTDHHRSYFVHSEAAVDVRLQEIMDTCVSGSSPHALLVTWTLPSGSQELVASCGNIPRQDSTGFKHKSHACLPLACAIQNEKSCQSPKFNQGFLHTCQHITWQTTEQELPFGSDTTVCH